MACGAIALQQGGINIENYDAYEIDKYAIQTSTHNFPFIKHHGDVFDADFTQFNDVDIVMGGSPCTYWSIAQTKNRETEASGMGWELFSQYVRAIKEVKPKYFIYENNKSMSNAIKESISNTFGFEPILINSALVSAQNRQRLYWVGKKNTEGGYDKVCISQPLDRGILLRDILESGQPFRKEKSPCIDACYYKGGNSTRPDCQSGMRLQVAETIKLADVGNGGQGNKLYSVDGKSVTQTANGGGVGSNTGLYAIPVNMTENGKSHCLRATCYKDGIRNLIANNTDRRTCVTIPTEYTKNSPVYKVKDGEILIKNNTYPTKLKDGFYTIRKLTVRECARLQTVPDWYEFPVSNTQAYKMLGNGWTVEVIVHLLKAILDEEKGSM